jgi:hypothetical protein
MLAAITSELEIKMDETNVNPAGEIVVSLLRPILSRKHNEWMLGIPEVSAISHIRPLAPVAEVSAKFLQHRHIH